MGTVDEHLARARAAEEAEAKKTPAQRKAEEAARIADEKKAEPEKEKPEKKK